MTVMKWIYDSDEVTYNSDEVNLQADSVMPRIVKNVFAASFYFENHAVLYIHVYTRNFFGHGLMYCGLRKIQTVLLSSSVSRDHAFLSVVIVSAFPNSISVTICCTSQG